MRNAVSPRKPILVGIMRVARGRADGIEYFGLDAQAYLSSLAPLIAFSLVGMGIGLLTEGPRRALTGLAMTLCALLAPAVISYELARHWKRTEFWVRFATAFNWCEWILPILFFLVMVPISVAMRIGLDEAVARLLVIGCLGLYGLWIHWFLARKALSLSGVRAFVLVLIVNLGTGTVVLGPSFLAYDAG